MACQAPAVGDEDGAAGAERGQHGLDAAVDQLAGGAGGGDRVVLEGVAVVAGERRQLVAVGLHQVRGGDVEPLDQGPQRGVAGVDGDPGAGPVQGGHQLGVPLVGGAGWQRAGEHDPVAAAGAPPQGARSARPRVARVISGPGLLSLVVVPSGSLIVMLTRRSPSWSTGRQSMPAASSSMHERVVLGGGQHRERRDAGRHRGAGDVDALAAGLRDDRRGTLHGAALQRLGERDRAVVAGVGGEGDDHATTTSRPGGLQGACGRSSSIPESVTRTSTSSSAANRTGRLDADLGGVGQHDGTAGGASDRPLGRGLVAVGGGQAVVGADARWWPRNATSARRSAERGDRVGADRGLGGRAHPAGQQVQLDLGEAREPRGDRHRVGDDGQPVVAGEHRGEPRGGRAGVEDDHRPGRGEQLDRGRGDRVLGAGVGLVALAAARPRSRRASWPAPHPRARGARVRYVPGRRGRGARSRW